MTDQPPERDLGRVLIGPVEGEFVFKQRGKVLLLETGHPEVPIKPGDPIELQFPDGRTVSTRLAGVGIGFGIGTSRVDVLLPKELDALEIPPGTKIWKTR